MQEPLVNSRSRSVLTGLLCSLTGFCARNAWLTIVVVVVSAVACVWYTSQNLTFKTDRADLINPSAKFYQRWLKYKKTFGEFDDIVVVVEGKSSESIERALDEIGSRLDAQPDHFANVLYKIDSTALSEKGLQFLPAEVLEEGLERLDNYRPVLNGNWNRIALNGVLNRLTQQLSRLNGQPDAASQLLHHTDVLVASLVNTLRERDEFTNPWPELLVVPDELRDQPEPATYLMNDSGTMGFVMASAVHDKGTFEGPTVAIDTVRSLLKDTARKFPDVRLLLTGISVLENDEMRRSMADSTTASILSFAGVAILLFLGFRGILHPLLGLFMLAMGMAWSFGYTTLVIGHLNILSVSFAAMLMGLGIDFAVHVLSRYLELRHEGHELVQALELTTDSVGVGIVTGAITTSLAFFCATLTDFLGVAELGVIAGGGIMLCALSAFTILPAIIAVADRKTPLKELPRPFGGQWLRYVTRNHPWIVLAMSLIGMGYIGHQAFDWSGRFPIPAVVYDHNLLHLQATGLESVEAQKHIFDSSSHSLLYALSIADSAEEARELKLQFEQLGSVRQVQELATRMPRSQSGQSTVLIQSFRDRLANLPEEPPAPPAANPADIGQSLEKLQQFLTGCPDQKSKQIAAAIEPFLEQLAEMSTRDQTMFLSEFQYRMAYALLAQFRAISEASNPIPVSVNDLPAALRSRFVSNDGKWLLQIYPRDQIWDMEPLERFVADVRSVDPDATGTPLQNYEAARQIKGSYEICALYALGVILITLLIDFTKKQNLAWTFIPPSAAIGVLGLMMKNNSIDFSPGLLLFTFTGIAFFLSFLQDRTAVGDSLLAIVPPLLGAGMTFGLLVMLDIPLNPANLIILPLILGIGVDNGVHILHDFHSKPHEVYSTSPSTINAIMLTSTTTMVGFGSMMVSAHRGLYSLGAVLTIGVGACLFVSLVTLPAWLTLISRHRGVAPTNGLALRTQSQVKDGLQSE